MAEGGDILLRSDEKKGGLPKPKWFLIDPGVRQPGKKQMNPRILWTYHKSHRKKFDGEFLTLPITSEELKTLFSNLNVGKPNRNSIISSFLEEGNIYELVSEINDLSGGIKLTETYIEDTRPGSVCVFETGFGKSTDVLDCNEDLLKRSFFQTSSDIKIILINADSLGDVDAKLKVYNKYKYFIDTRGIFLQHVHGYFDEAAKLIAHSKILLCCRFVDKMKSKIESFLARERHPMIVMDPAQQTTDSLYTVIERSIGNTLTRENVMDICYGINVEKVGSAYDGVCLCFSVFTVRDIKESLVKSAMIEIAKSLGKKISDQVLHHMERVFQNKLLTEFERFQISDDIYEQIEHTLVRRIIEIFETVSGWIVTIATAIITFFIPVDVNSKRWRRQVADEIFSKVRTQTDFIRDFAFKEILGIWERTIIDLKIIATYFDEFRTDTIPLDQNAKIKQWRKREVLQVISKVSMGDCPSILQCIAGYNGDGKEVMKVFVRGEKPESEKERKSTKVKLRSCFEVPDNYKFEIVYVDTKVKEIKEKTREIKLKEQEFGALVIDMPTYKLLGESIKKHSKRIYACFTNVVSIGISKVRCVGNEIRAETCITLYCLDKNLIPFGEEALPSYLDGWPCDVREDIVMFGNTCPSNCPAIYNDLPELGCSIGIKEKQSSGSVGFLVEYRDPGNGFPNGFLTASHVAVDNFADYYNENLLSKHDYPSFSNVIVHPSYEDSAAQSQYVGHVVKSIFGDYVSASIDVALVETRKRESKDKVILQVFTDEQRILNEKLMVTKTGRTTGKTTGVLKYSNYSIKVNLPFPSQEFLSFRNCYAVEDLDEKSFFSQGDSGAGVFVEDTLSATKKPLGIAFAFSGSFTAVSRIDLFIKDVGCYIVGDNDDIQIPGLCYQLGNISLG